MDMEQYFKEELAFPEEEVVSSTIKRSLAAKLSIETSHEPAGVWKVVFTFPEPVVVEEKVSERSLLLRFNQSIDTPDLAKAEEPLAFLIKTASNGYNTLYLEGERNIQFHTQVSGAVFTLILQPDYTQQIPATTALKTAYARLLIEERHYSKALCALSSITKENPCDKGARQLFASAEGLIPLWKRQKQS
jgi:predicted Zn-dependent protease